MRFSLLQINKTILAILKRISSTPGDLPWSNLFSLITRIFNSLTNSPSSQGMYEVLEYESELILKDKKGQRASFRKREKVRYLQDNIIAYQDHAWGDGEGLLDYKCSPGVVVDRYRPGAKTFVLVSLRGSRQKGDTDEFNVQWNIKDGFVRETEMWETDVRHRTRQIKIQVVFPKTRPPLRVWLEQNTRREKKLAGGKALKRLPDGRWRVTWQPNKPVVNERYQIHWTW